ncbi:NUDIX domain-containing protein [Tropicimonas isoalkanivorans]|uniref:ADP-ribose pyrophosphatase YjhB, NUDIX family n=1 Tax=Tropicimonas isoalkanivorans TaxID=441112 RepID=A0A1I1Q348_9RHOB|nr:NUDIX hydrolase [Tropicimonas isoalkanivorans]SFD12570.1 ADP-ribose pyrophosphatase YjhB, NUDIX family [Tropicimonas isoalkanivorans]
MTAPGGDEFGKLIAERTPRLAVRAIILREQRLLLVNAWPGADCDLWCAPGGGVTPGHSLPDNLAREVREETGLAIEVGVPCLVNEFHDPASGFHQVEIFFRCHLANGALEADCRDPEGVVTRHRWVARAEMKRLRSKPGQLAEVAWGGGLAYDPLELLVR